MANNVVHLVVDAVGDGTVLDCDKILAAAAGAFDEIVVLGINKGGDVDVRGSKGVRDTMFLIELAKASLIESMTE